MSKLIKCLAVALILLSGITAANAAVGGSYSKNSLTINLSDSPGYQLAKSYWLGGADIDLGFKGDDDATVCQSRGYTTGSCGTNQEIVSYCGAGNQYHRCGCNDRIYRYDDITCGRDAYPDMSDEYVCKTSSSGSGKSDRCICYADDQRWIDGSCVFYCSQDSHCADDEICITSTGQCEFKDCEIYGCDGGQVCYNHYCEVPNCVNKGTSCVQGEKCDSVSKQCVEDPNTCPSGYQESACSDKQVSDGSNHTTSSGKVCYACRAKTCDDLNCDSVRQTCNSAALICVDKAGCSSGDSTTACKSDQKPLGTYVADNGDTCYQCQNMTCQEQLEAAGYGIDGAFGTNGTSVITKNITLNNFTNNKKYISLKGLSFSKCQYTDKPKVTLTQTTPVLTAVSLDNLIVNGSGSAVLKGTARVKDVDFTGFPYLDIGGHDFANSNITFEGAVTLTGKEKLLTIYKNATLYVNGDFSTFQTTIKEGGIVHINDNATVSLVYNQNLNSNGTLKMSTKANLKVGGDFILDGEMTNLITSTSSTPRGIVTASNLTIQGEMNINRKNVTISGKLTIKDGGKYNPLYSDTTVNDAWFAKGGVFSPSHTTFRVKSQFTIYSVGTQFTTSNTTIYAKEAFIACEPNDVNKKHYSAAVRLNDNSHWIFESGNVLHMGRGESVICFKSNSTLKGKDWEKKASSSIDYDGARVEGADNHKNISYDSNGSGSKKLNYKNRGTCSSYGT